MSCHYSNWSIETLHSTNVSQENLFGLANSLREHTGQSLTEPLKLAPILNGLKIELHFYNNFGLDGALVPADKDRFLVFMQNPRPTCSVKLTSKIKEKDIANHKQRHVLAHEIGHTFFYSRHPDREPRIYATSSSDNTKDLEIAKESFAEDFARQLLVPYETVYKTKKSPEHVSRKFNISLQLAKLAISGEPMIKVFKENDRISGKPIKKFKYMIEYCE